MKFFSIGPVFLEIFFERSIKQKENLIFIEKDRDYGLHASSKRSATFTDSLRELSCSLKKL